jgi:hypothetical protein
MLLANTVARHIFRQPTLLANEMYDALRLFFALLLLLLMLVAKLVASISFALATTAAHHS